MRPGTSKHPVQKARAEQTPRAVIPLAPPAQSLGTERQLPTLSQGPSTNSANPRSDLTGSAGLMLGGDEITLDTLRYLMGAESRRPSTDPILAKRPKPPPAKLQQPTLDQRIVQPEMTAARPSSSGHRTSPLAAEDPNVDNWIPKVPAGVSARTASAATTRNQPPGSSAMGKPPSRREIHSATSSRFSDSDIGALVTVPDETVANRALPGGYVVAGSTKNPLEGGSVSSNAKPDHELLHKMLNKLRLDKKKQGKSSIFLDCIAVAEPPCNVVASSRVPMEHWLSFKGPIAKVRNDAVLTTAEDGTEHNYTGLIFPSERNSAARPQVAYLANALDEMLNQIPHVEMLSDAANWGINPRTTQSGEADSANGADTPDLSVECLDVATKVSRVLDVGFSEVGRQMVTHCAERTALLEKLRSSVLDLLYNSFDAVEYLQQELRRLRLLYGSSNNNLERQLKELERRVKKELEPELSAANDRIDELTSEVNRLRDMKERAEYELLSFRARFDRDIVKEDMARLEKSLLAAATDSMGAAQQGDQQDDDAVNPGDGAEESPAVAPAAEAEKEAPHQENSTKDLQGKSQQQQRQQTTAVQVLSSSILFDRSFSSAGALSPMMIQAEEQHVLYLSILRYLNELRRLGDATDKAVHPVYQSVQMPTTNPSDHVTLARGRWRRMVAAVGEFEVKLDKYEALVKARESMLATLPRESLSEEDAELRRQVEAEPLPERPVLILPEEAALTAADFTTVLEDTMISLREASTKLDILANSELYKSLSKPPLLPPSAPDIPCALCSRVENAATQRMRGKKGGAFGALWLETTSGGGGDGSGRDGSGAMSATAANTIKELGEQIYKQSKQLDESAAEIQRLKAELADTVVAKYEVEDQLRTLREANLPPPPRLQITSPDSHEFTLMREHSSQEDGVDSTSRMTSPDTLLGAPTIGISRRPTAPPSHPQGPLITVAGPDSESVPTDGGAVVDSEFGENLEATMNETSLTSRLPSGLGQEQRLTLSIPESRLAAQGGGPNTNSSGTTHSPPLKIELVINCRCQEKGSPHEGAPKSNSARRRDDVTSTSDPLVERYATLPVLSWVDVEDEESQRKDNHYSGSSDPTSALVAQSSGLSLSQAGTGALPSLLPTLSKSSLQLQVSSSSKDLSTGAGVDLPTIVKGKIWAYTNQAVKQLGEMLRELPRQAQSGGISTQNTKPLPWVLKTINGVYKAKLHKDLLLEYEGGGHLLQSLKLFVQDHFRILYGTKSLMESNLGVLVRSLSYHAKTDLRVLLFSKFLTGIISHQTLRVVSWVARVLDDMVLGPELSEGANVVTREAATKRKEDRAVRHDDESERPTSISLLRVLKTVAVTLAFKPYVQQLSEELWGIASTLTERQLVEGLVKAGYGPSIVRNAEQRGKVSGSSTSPVVSGLFESRTVGLSVHSVMPKDWSDHHRAAAWRTVERTDFLALVACFEEAQSLH